MVRLDYTLLPLHQRAMYAPDELQVFRPQFREAVFVHKGMPCTQDCHAKGFLYPCMSVAAEENHDLLFDLMQDPEQSAPMQDDAIALHMIQEMLTTRHTRCPGRAVCPGPGLETMYRDFISGGSTQNDFHSWGHHVPTLFATYGLKHPAYIRIWTVWPSAARCLSNTGVVLRRVCPLGVIS